MGFIRAGLMLFRLGRGCMRLGRDIYKYTGSYVTSPFAVLGEWP